MKEVVHYLSLVLLTKAVDTLNITLRCLLVVLNGAEFLTEKPFYQQLRLEGRSVYRTPQARKMVQKKMRNRFRMLERRGFVEKYKRGNHFWYILTTKGKLSLLREAIKYAPNLTGNERIFVSYDIPEDFRAARDLFRRFLYKAGFRQCHKSILVSDRDVEMSLLEFVQANNLYPWVKIIRGTSKNKLTKSNDRGVW